MNASTAATLLLFAYDSRIRFTDSSKGEMPERYKVTSCDNSQEPYPLMCPLS
jgi:hypothetical protein